MRQNACIALAAMLIGTVAVAQPEAAAVWNDNKPAWQWTTEERLAKRFDRTEMRSRAEADSARLEKLRELGMPNVEPFAINPDQDGIDGKKSPELFLPSELFDQLLMDAFPPDGRLQQQSRRFIEERAAALGLGADLWKRLRRVSSPYLELRRERDRLMLDDHQGESTTERLDGVRAPDVLCRTRAQVIAAAKEEFGEAVFLRLLYEAVAPRLGVTYLLEENLMENLRRQEEGCR